MDRLINRIENPNPHIKYSEINIPDQSKTGTGFYITAIKSNYLNKKDPIVSIMYNPSLFQISVNINPATHKIPVMLGRENPISTKIFLLPEKIPKSKLYVFKVTFKDWEILELSMNGKPLEIMNNDGIQVIKENGIPTINNIKFFEKHLEILEEVFLKDFFSNTKNETHPAYIRGQLCKKIIEQKGIIKFPEQKDELHLFAKIILDSVIFISLSEGNIQDIKFGLMELVGDENILKKIRTRIVKSEQFEDLMVELYFASWHKSRKNKVRLIEKDGFPDMEIFLTGKDISLPVECKKITVNSYNRFNKVLQKANKQIKKFGNDYYGLAVLDISDLINEGNQDKDKLEVSITDIKDIVERVLNGRKNRCVKRAILIWNDYIIEGNPPQDIFIGFRKNFAIIKNEIDKTISDELDEIKFFEGNTVTYWIRFKERLKS